MAISSKTGVAARATAVFREERNRNPNATVFPEYPLNLLGYEKLQAG